MDVNANSRNTPCEYLNAVLLSFIAIRNGLDHPWIHPGILKGVHRSIMWADPNRSAGRHCYIHSLLLPRSSIRMPIIHLCYYPLGTTQRITIILLKIHSTILSNFPPIPLYGWMDSFCCFLPMMAGMNASTMHKAHVIILVGVDRSTNE